MIKLEPIPAQVLQNVPPIPSNEDTQNGTLWKQLDNDSNQIKCDQDSPTNTLKTLPMAQASEIDILDDSNDTKVLMKKPLSKKEDKSTVEAVVDMICRSLVEPDVVAKILEPLVPMDVMSLELAMPGLTSILWPRDHDQQNKDVKFDFVRWRKRLSEEYFLGYSEEELVDCDIDDEGAFVRVRLDGSHVTAVDVSDRWIALGYYSGAIRLFDRKKLSFKKLVYDGKKAVDRYSGKISSVWIHQDTVITIDTRNTLVVRTVGNLDSPVKHALGDSLEHVVVQKNICLQVFNNQENYELSVFQVEGVNMSIIKQMSIPKIVTSNIIKVSLNTTTKQLLLYYEEEMMDYKTWKNVELFGDQLSHQFQQFYTTFTNHQILKRTGQSTSIVKRAHFLVIIEYESGLFCNQYKINPGNLVIREQSSLRVLNQVGEGREENLWKLLKPSIKQEKQNGAHLIPNQVLEEDDSFNLRKVPNKLIQNVLTVPAIDQQFDEDSNGKRTIKCKLVSKNVFCDARSLIYHAEENGHADVTILDLWKGDWEASALYKPIEWRNIPDLVESSEDSDTGVDSDEETDSDVDSDDVDYHDIHPQWEFGEPNPHFQIAIDEDTFEIEAIEDEDDDVLEVGEILQQNDDEPKGESEDEMPSLETGTGDF